MRSCEASGTIPVPQRDAWQILSSVTEWPQWLPTVTKVEPLDEQRLRLGARYRILQPKLRPAIWTVTRCDAPHRFTWVMRSFGLVAVADHAVETQGPASCRVSLRVEFHGLLSGVAFLFAGPLTRRYLATELAMLSMSSADSAHRPGPGDIH